MLEVNSDSTSVEIAAVVDFNRLVAAHNHGMISFSEFVEQIRIWGDNAHLDLAVERSDGTLIRDPKRPSTLISTRMRGLPHPAPKWPLPQRDPASGPKSPVDRNAE